jgi:hypothetical protein
MPLPENPQKAPLPDATRRKILTYSLTGLAAGMIAWNRYPSWLPQASAQANPAGTSNVTTPAFAAVTAHLLGSVTAQPALLQRLYQTLHDMYPVLDTQLESIASVITQQVPAASSNLRDQLVQKDAQLGELWTDLINGLYLGVVGSGFKRRCIAFENIVSYQVVSYALLPVSYAPGAPNFWTNPVVVKDQKHV